MALSLADEQLNRFIAFLSHQRTCIISTAALQGVWAMPVWYRLDPGSAGSRSIQVHCLVPRWTDIAHPLTQDLRVILIIQAFSGAGLRWLQIQGTARRVESPDWSRLLPRRISTVQPDALYLVVRVTPNRIDLIDEELGWGVRETLEL